MWGLELDRPAPPVVEAALERGLLVNRTADTVVRLLPPYIITAGEIDEALRPARRGARRRWSEGHSIMNASVTLRTAQSRRTRRPSTG